MFKMNNMVYSFWTSIKEPNQAKSRHLQEPVPRTNQPRLSARDLTEKKKGRKKKEGFNRRKERFFGAEEVEISLGDQEAFEDGPILFLNASTERKGATAAQWSVLAFDWRW